MSELGADSLLIGFYIFSIYFCLSIFLPPLTTTLPHCPPKTLHHAQTTKHHSQRSVSYLSNEAIFRSVPGDIPPSSVWDGPTRSRCRERSVSNIFLIRLIVYLTINSYRPTGFHGESGRARSGGHVTVQFRTRNRHYATHHVYPSDEGYERRYGRGGGGRFAGRGRNNGRGGRGRGERGRGGRGRGGRGK
jgi:hypothetical protein